MLCETLSTRMRESSPISKGSSTIRFDERSTCAPVSEKEDSRLSDHRTRIPATVVDASMGVMGWCIYLSQ